MLQALMITCPIVRSRVIFNQISPIVDLIPYLVILIKFLIRPICSLLILTSTTKFIAMLRFDSKILRFLS